MALTTGEKIAHVISWVGVLVLFLIAVAIADILGFAGLIMLGLFAALICTKAELDQDVPIGTRRAFEAHQLQARTPEERAAKWQQRMMTATPLKFCTRCGLTLAVIGLAGFVWQWWIR